MERGFTLIELIVSVAIIGIIAAIAIPEYKNFKMRAYHARAQFDARNMISAQEVYFADEEVYFDYERSKLEANNGVIVPHLSGFTPSDFSVVAAGTTLDKQGFNFIGACNVRGENVYSYSTVPSIAAASFSMRAGVLTRSRNVAIGDCNIAILED